MKLDFRATRLKSKDVLVSTSLLPPIWMVRAIDVGRVATDTSWDDVDSMPSLEARFIIVIQP
jgi:hypothetical protein